MDEHVGIEQAVQQYAQIEDAIKTLYDEKDKLFQIIWNHMDSTGATELSHPKFRVTKPLKRSYDVTKFEPIMGEVLPPDELAAVFTPAHEETRTVPAKVDGVKAKRLWNMGSNVTEALDKVTLPQKPSIKVEKKMKEQAF